jgi:hypothetical protein
MDVSNKTLAVLLVLAIIVAVGGTIISLDRFGKLGITGMPVVNASESTGSTSVSIAANAQITLRVETVAFGSWRINGSTSTKNCTLTSRINGTTNAGNTFSPFAFLASSDCINVSNNDAPDAFELENTGSETFLNITMNASTNHTAFISGEASDLRRYRIIEEVNACNDGSSTGNETTGTIDNVTTYICNNFNVSDTQDAIAIQVNLTLPSTTPAGTYSDTITFKGAMV